MKQTCGGGPRRVPSDLIFYTAGFGLMLAALLLPFFLDGLTLIHGSDGYTQHYPVFVYLHNYFYDVLGNLLKGDFSVPLFDFSIGLGEDILLTLNYYGLGDPLYFLCAMVPQAALPVSYVLLFVLRGYLGGLCFMAFCREQGKTGRWAAAGAWLYVFSGLYLSSVYQQVYGHALLYMPLMFWGLERFLRGKSPAVFVLGVCCFALSGFYFLVLSSWALAAYILIRSLGGGLAGWVRTSFRSALKALWAYGTGLALAGVLFLPQVCFFLSSQRNVKEWRPLLDSLAGYGQTLREALATGGALSLGGLALLGAVLALAAPKGQKKLKLALCAALLPMLSPFVSGMLILFTQSENDQWWFLSAFALCYGAVCVLPRAGRYTRRQMAACGLFTLLCLALAWAGRENGNLVRGALFLALTFGALVLAQFWHSRPAGPRRSALLLCGLCAVQQIVCLWGWAMGVREGFHSVLYAKPMATLTGDELPEGETYRVDVTDVSLYRWWSGSNASMMGGYNGLSAYFSMLNPDVLGFLDDLGLAAARQRAYYYRSLDGCAILNTLASVKYIFLRRGEEWYLPYGYNRVGVTPQSTQIVMADTGGNRLERYENLLQLPLGYTYSGYISRQTYEELDGYEKQVAMMQGIVVDQIPEGGREIQPSWDGLTRMDCTLAATQNCVETEPGVFQYQEGASWQGQALPGDALWPEGEGHGFVCYLLDVPANSEAHVCLPYLQREGQHAWISAHCGSRTESFWVTDENNIEGAGLSRTAWINLGYFEEGGQVALFLEVPQGEPISYGQVWARAYDMDQYEQYAGQRAQTTLQEVEVSDNHVTGKITSEEDTILCFSVPYSGGWQAMVDGQPVESFRANRAFIGLEVPAGTHDVELYYITPGLKQGILLSGAGLVSLAVLLVVYRKRKNGGQNGSLAANP